MSSLEPYMQVLAEKLNDKGYDAKVVLFDANNMAAIAAKDGDIDGFMHNHLPWIKTFNEENNSHLIMPEPLLAYYRTAMYSTKYNSVDELPDNAKIGYPNDPTNVEKSLQMLERIGLIKLGEKQDVFYNALDIVENPKNIELVETEISTTARIINDVDTVICPATRILQAGLDPNAFIVEDEAAVDQAVSLTIDEKNSDQQWVKDAMELMHSDEMRATFDELFKGTIILYDK